MATRRLMREAKDFASNPIREFTAMPTEDNILEWHFTMRGPEGTPYGEGFYHGRVLVPNNYPFAPPDVVLLTPNGRFELDKRICLSISSYHPEHWQSTWGIATVLHALRDFMSTPGNNGIGAIEYSETVRRELAAKSETFECPHCGCKVAEVKETLLKSPPSTTAQPVIPKPTGPPRVKDVENNNTAAGASASTVSGTNSSVTDAAALSENSLTGASVTEANATHTESATKITEKTPATVAASPTTTSDSSAVEGSDTCPKCDDLKDSAVDSDTTPVEVQERGPSEAQPTATPSGGPIEAQHEEETGPAAAQTAAGDAEAPAAPVDRREANEAYDPNGFHFEVSIAAIDRALVFAMVLLLTLLAKKWLVDLGRPDSAASKSIAMVSSVVNVVMAPWREE